MDNQVQHVEIYAVVQVGKDGFEEAIDILMFERKETVSTFVIV